MPSAPASPGNVPVSILVSIGTLVGGLYGFRYVREYREKQEWRDALTLKTREELEELLQQTKDELARHEAAMRSRKAGQ